MGKERLWDALRGLQDDAGLNRIFCDQLGYDYVNRPLATRGWSEKAVGFASEITLLASHDEFHIAYVRLDSDRLLLGQERPLVGQILRRHPYSLTVFSNKTQDRWHFVNVKLLDERDADANRDAKKRRLFRRISVGPDEKLGNRLRTAAERLSCLDVPEGGLPPLELQKRHDEAFDVEAVTRQFYEEYASVFGVFQEDLRKRTRDEEWAHDYALQFLNRLMFLYFVQRKRWLGDDPEFLRTFWNAYGDSKQPKNSFFDRWLKVLFFEAFNNRFHGGHRQFPKGIREALAQAPFLNGGLFKENDLDQEYDCSIKDSRFGQVFQFLERYNFTIAENTPLDQEVAVDPEMIGKVYESLVNVSTEADKRGEAGIFYTPRTEIDLMCRLALVDNLANHLGQDHKNPLYEVVFALEPGEKEEADRSLAGANLWSALDDRLREMAVLDPACGSGSFLVGMLNILNDLGERADHQLSRHESSFDRKRRIIGQNLYGVDVMDWACHVAELRLWLALIIDADIRKEELHIRREPLLPHFSFKVRCGDSLVQEVGGVNLGHVGVFRDIPWEIKSRITRLKNEKLSFYNNDPTCRFRTKKAVEREELRLFRDILGAEEKSLKDKIKRLRDEIDQPVAEQMGLDGTVQSKPRQLELKSAKLRQELEERVLQLERIDGARAALRSVKGVPFVWDVAFVEVFEGEQGGFDIVVGNPPYVSQESISDPYQPRDAITAAKKRAYKAKLERSVYQMFPRFFGYSEAKDSDRKKPAKAVTREMNGKSNLYIYFYFHGLHLLNPKGTFCFITQNSWLDSGYGRDLQEFLLRRCHVKAVLDNWVKRSFEADVNTVICLFSAPHKQPDAGLHATARFVMFLVPFEQILSPVVFEVIGDTTERTTTPEYRVHPASQAWLLGEGSDVVADEASGPAQVLSGPSDSSPLVDAVQYAGEKWGGKYLRSPDIYWTIMEKGQRLVRRLSEFFEGERYLNTGGADGFFIVTDVSPGAGNLLHVTNGRTTQGGSPFEGDIEKRYLVPLIKDYTKTDKRISIHGYDAYCLVVTGKPTKRLARYIAWGERQGYNRRSVTKNQHPWYKPTNQMLNSAKILVPRSFNDTFAIFYNPKDYLSLRYYRLHSRKGSSLRLAAFLNSSLVVFFLETLGNKGLGQGVLEFYMADFLTMKIPYVDDPSLAPAFKELMKRPVQRVQDEYQASTSSRSSRTRFAVPKDRRELDDVIFDALGLTRGEREAVYESIVCQVEARLRKAASV